MNRLKEMEFDEENAKPARGYRLFRALARSVYELIRTLKFARNRRVKRREAKIEDFEDGLPLYIDVAKGWFLKACKQPIMSLLQEPESSLDFTNCFTDSEKSKRFIKTQVRIRVIFKELIKSINDLAKPLLLFLKSISDPETILPDDFLTKFEKYRLDLDDENILIGEASNGQKQCLYGVFMFGRVLIKEILLKPHIIAVGICYII
jgi:hypothetical protein